MDTTQTLLPLDDQAEEEPERSIKSQKVDKGALEELYDKTSARILQERNDFFLPQIMDFVVDNKWINLRPEYQRRRRWDLRTQSKLIESLLMNVPVPPIFLFENDLNRYEVMDGQQRLVSIIDFYENRLELKGLKAWSVLNGLKYSDRELSP